MGDERAGVACASELGWGAARWARRARGRILRRLWAPWEEMAAQKPTARRLGPSGAGSEQRGRAVGSAIQHGQVGRCLGAGAVGRGYAAWIEWGLEMSSNLYQGRLASRSGASGKR